MSLFSQFQNRILGWWHDVPIPPHETDATPTFQAWHRYDPLTTKWDPASSGTSAETDPGKDENAFKDSKFVLATWNVDAAAPAPEARISALISYFQNMDGQPDIIFLQEISRHALSRLLELPWIREFWYSSEADATNWGTRPFTNITLISKERFNLKPNPATKKNDMAGLDRVWRVKYPSRFGRDALCCDILLPSTSPSSPDTGPTRETKTEPSRIRLINVHLDSLPVNPSLRPRQHTISASYLRAAGHGVMAGDFNPVLPEDETLIGDNHLVDAWSELYPDKDGFTWGVNGDAPFPPGRLDRVATLGLKSCSMKVAQPGECTERIMVEQKGKQGQDYEEVTVPWTDHSGLVYEFGL